MILSAVVLLQAGQGGGLASLGGATTDSVLGGRQAVTILTKLSWWCGGIFLALALLLSLVPRGRSGSALQERIRATTPGGSRAYRAATTWLAIADARAGSSTVRRRTSDGRTGDAGTGALR